jgi:hypothetical protein
LFRRSRRSNVRAKAWATAGTGRLLPDVVGSVRPTSAVRHLIGRTSLDEVRRSIARGARRHVIGLYSRLGVAVRVRQLEVSFVRSIAHQCRTQHQWLPASDPWRTSSIRSHDDEDLSAYIGRPFLAWPRQVITTVNARATDEIDSDILGKQHYNSPKRCSGNPLECCGIRD